MQEDMLVLAKYKDEPESDWFEMLLTDDQRMIEKATGKEITRTDLLFKSDEDSEVIDMEQEWEEYRSDKIKDILHWSARYLAKQVASYNKENGEQE